MLGSRMTPSMCGHQPVGGVTVGGDRAAVAQLDAQGCMQKSVACERSGGEVPNAPGRWRWPSSLIARRSLLRKSGDSPSVGLHVLA
jgi:hypothetical protein